MESWKQLRVWVFATRSLLCVFSNLHIAFTYVQSNKRKWFTDSSSTRTMTLQSQLRTATCCRWQSEQGTNNPCRLVADPLPHCCDRGTCGWRGPRQRPNRKSACRRRRTPASRYPCPETNHETKNSKNHLAKFPSLAPLDQMRHNKGGQREVGKGGRAYVRGRVDVADLAGVGLVGLDVGAGVRVPEAEGSVLAAAQAVVAVAVETHREHRPLVTRQWPRLRPRQMLRGRPRGRHRLVALSPPAAAAAEDGMVGKKTGSRRPPREKNGGPVHELGRPVGCRPTKQL